MSLDDRPIPAPADAEAAAPEEPIYRLAVAQYLAMVEATILVEDDPVELLEGWLVHKLRKSPPHVVATGLVRCALQRLVPQEWHVDTHELVVTADSVPETDVMWVRGGQRDYLEHHPGPGDVALIVEVADRTLGRDRRIKKRIYARAGIPVYWIVNLVDRRIEVYTEASGAEAPPDYAQRLDYSPDEEIPIVLGGVQIGRIPVHEMLP
jgi:Uma2 family endonuclease